MREEVTGVLRSWILRAVFPKEYILGLEASFFRQVVPTDDLQVPPGFQNELEIKVCEWRAQHFSQLEKICRRRGLRWATMGLFPDSKSLVEEATRKREWLIDRLVLYEIHVFERAPDPEPEPDPVTNAPAQPEIVLPPPNPELDGESCVGSDLEDLDGEAVEPPSRKGSSRKKRDKQPNTEAAKSTLGGGRKAPRLKKHWECTNVHSSLMSDAIDFASLKLQKEKERRKKEKKKREKEERHKKREQEAAKAEAEKKKEADKKKQVDKNKAEKKEEPIPKKKAKGKQKEQVVDHCMAMHIPQGEAARTQAVDDELDGQPMWKTGHVRKTKYAVDIANSDMFRE